MPLTVQTISERQNMVEFAVNGRLDNSTSPGLENAIQPALNNPDIRTIVLRMSGLDFISSAGIRVLIEAQNTVSARGGRVLLVDLQPQIQKVLEIIKALPGISVFRNAEEMDEYLATIQRRIKEQQ